ncbi:MAG TPA: hypothetical protein PLP89_06600 [Synergistales bacterium]|jgi:hypothetical protein|nr:hypothetical protein [Synergistales bacterium]HRV71660.1 hypothetical protein [Thermovirgaceae bacterium]
MRKTRFSIGVLAFFALFAMAVSVCAVSGPYTLHATVVSGQESVHAARKGAEFLVPPGSTAVITHYWWHDPGSGQTSDRLRSNIFSVEKAIYMVDNNGDGIRQLPPGTYRFIIGGPVGATGKLVYELHP